MPRGKGGLAFARERMETESETPDEVQPTASSVPIAIPVEAKPARSRPNAGKLHIGGYYDPDDTVVEAFRRLAFETRRSQQELLREAMSALLAKQAGEATFASATKR